MPEALVPALLVLASYAAGALPFGWAIARAVAGVDVRTVGSGNVGATNVARLLGKPWFAVVFAFYAAKGALPVLVLPPLAGPAPPHLLAVGCGVAAVLGHVLNPFLRFRGGKGVATAAGAIAALAPLAAAAGLAVFLVVLALSRYVSLGSVVAAVALVPLAWLLGSPREVVAFTVVAAAVVVVRHRSNLGRIRAGTEPRAFRRKEAHGG